MRGMNRLVDLWAIYTCLPIFYEGGKTLPRFLIPLTSFTVDDEKSQQGAAAEWDEKGLFVSLNTGLDRMEKGPQG